MTVFSVWAPAAGQVEVEVAGQRYAMARENTGTQGNTGPGSGWWSAGVPGVSAGLDYGFRLDGGDPLPDPRSLRQPSGIRGLSRTYDQSAFRWTDRSWRGGPLAGSVIYELHVGTFTSQGTFDAAIERLVELRDLGVHTVELMPVAAFPGDHGWGYDGINLWAVHEPYGGPDGLKRFVDACHARGLAVMLDVVYNHVGIGNRLGDFGPYFTEAHVTPWGPAVNLDQPGSDEVRAFLIGNALMWLRDYHLDGLRLDAVHALEDHRALYFLEELAAEVQALAARLNRELVLVAESDTNDPRLVTSREAGGYGLNAQWSDDFHHAVHAAITGERQGYYCDFGSLAALAKTYTKVFFHDGIWSAFRGRTHGRQVDVFRVPAYRFLGYLQDHDQIGNRATGDRTAATLPADLVKVGAGLVLTSPYTPMLFMGEEWGADTPWQYFTDHIEPWLAAAVAEGRKAEFSGHGWGPAEVPDPQDKETFLRSKLDWKQREREPYLGILAWYRELIALRRARPELTDPRLDRIRADFDEDARWLLVRRGRLRIAANLGPAAVRLPLGQRGIGLLAASSPEVAITQDTVSMPAASFAVIETQAVRPGPELRPQAAAGAGPQAAAGAGTQATAGAGTQTTAGAGTQTTAGDAGCGRPLHARHRRPCRRRSRLICPSRTTWRLRRPQRWSIAVVIATSMEHRCGSAGTGLGAALLGRGDQGGEGPRVLRRAAALQRLGQGMGELEGRAGPEPAGAR
jgi:malto-oligosyltrehalose trehalohydrolase